jgi:rRNA maturation endonuclease Nob1
MLTCLRFRQQAISSRDRSQVLIVNDRYRLQSIDLQVNLSRSNHSIKSKVGY